MCMGTMAMDVVVYQSSGRVAGTLHCGIKAIVYSIGPRWAKRIVFRAIGYNIGLRWAKRIFFRAIGCNIAANNGI